MTWWRITFINDKKELVEVDVRSWNIDDDTINMTRLEDGVLWKGSTYLKSVTNMMCLGGGP